MTISVPVWCDHCLTSYEVNLPHEHASDVVRCPSCAEITTIVWCGTCEQRFEIADVNEDAGTWVCPVCKQERTVSAESLLENLEEEIRIERDQPIIDVEAQIGILSDDPEPTPANPTPIESTPAENVSSSGFSENKSVLLIGLLLVACYFLFFRDTSTNDQAALTEPPNSIVRPTHDTRMSLTMEAAIIDDPGMACFGTRWFGLSCISAEGKWLQFTEDNSKLHDDFIVDLQVCPDNTILIEGLRGLQTFDGKRFSTPNVDAPFSGSFGLACAGDGELWAAHFEGVSHYDGSRWTTYASDELNSTGDVWVNGVQIDGFGNVWVITSHTIARFDEDHWTIFEERNGLDDEYSFATLNVGLDGYPIATSFSALLKYNGRRWQRLADYRSIHVTDVAIAQDGHAYIGTHSEGVFDFDGSVQRAMSIGNGLSANRVEKLAFDQSGRLFIATIAGLDVWDGENWTYYTMDSADIVSNEFTSIAIVNGGPKLPAVVDKTNGSLIGSLKPNGEVLAGSTVLLCASSDTWFDFQEQPPCREQPNVYESKSAADGTFRFDDLPVAHYYLFFEFDGHWIPLNDRSFDDSTPDPVTVFEGETTDVGVLVP